jgi:hypothetical protein
MDMVSAPVSSCVFNPLFGSTQSKMPIYGTLPADGIILLGIAYRNCCVSTFYKRWPHIIHEGAGHISDSRWLII